MFDIPSKQDDDDGAVIEGRRLSHVETGASPLFIYSPGRFMNCHHELLDKLQTHPTHRSLKKHNGPSHANGLNKPITSPISAVPQYRISLESLERSKTVLVD